MSPVNSDETLTYLFSSFSTLYSPTHFSAFAVHETPTTAMMFMTIAAALLTAVSSLATTGASPVEIRDVYSPPMLYPHAGTVWYSGQTHNVTC